MTTQNSDITTTSPTPLWVPQAWRVLRDNSPDGVAIFDHRLRYVAVNPALATRNGVPVADHIGKTLDEVVPNLAGVKRQAFTQVLATGQPLLGLELSGTVASTPGRTRHWVENAYPVPGLDGMPVGVAVLAWEVTDRRQTGGEPAARQATEADVHRLRLLHRLTGALANAVETEQVAQVVVDLAEQTLGAQAAAVARFDGTRCQILAAAGPGQVHRAHRREPFEIAAYPALVEVVGSHPHAVCWSSHAEKDHRYPSPMANGPFAAESGAITPLLVDGHPVGFVGVGWSQQRAVGSADIDLLETVAAQTVAAIERARLLEAERHAQRRLRLLAEVSTQLASAAEETEQLSRLANLLLTGGFADVATVVLPDEVGTLRRRIVVCADPVLDDEVFRAFGRRRPEACRVAHRQTHRGRGDGYQPVCPRHGREPRTRRPDPPDPRRRMHDRRAAGRARPAPWHLHRMA